jgi:hypothetical protein
MAKPKLGEGRKLELDVRLKLWLKLDGPEREFYLLK